MSRLSTVLMLWLLLLLAAAPASAVMDVQPRNHTWELPASSYDLAPDVRDGPNLYAYVKQNPWTAFDPDGLAETAVTKAIRERSQAVAQAYESAGRGDGAAAQKAQFTRGQAVAGAMAKSLNEIVSNTPIGAANEALTGKNASGEPLSAGEHLAVMAGFIPAGKFVGKLGKAGVDALATSAQKISKEADEIVNAIRKGGDGAAKTAGTRGFRYVTEGEIQAIKDTGMLRGGRPGETYFTKDLYKCGTDAQKRLSLPSTPTHRVEFEITNNPSMLRNGTKVDPVGSLPGKGAEFMTTDPVHVDLINLQPLR